MPINSGSWLLSLLVLHCIIHTLGIVNPKIIYSWIYPNFKYPSAAERMKAIQNGSYVLANGAIIDSDSYIDPKTKKKRVWVTTPQFREGIPATFCEVLNNSQTDPLMSPFPSWAAQNQKTCDGLVSVYRFHVDSDCHLMWVIDSGYVNSFVNPVSACPPKLLVYDLSQNDKLVMRYEFPNTVVYPNTILNSIALNPCKSDCLKPLCTIADCTSFGIIIFDPAKNASSRIYADPYCYPDPKQGFQTINGTTFELMDGVFSVQFSRVCNENQTLYYHSLASIQESSILVRHLLDPKLITDPIGTRFYFNHSADIRAGPGTMDVITWDGVMLYVVLNETAIACWNTADPLEKQYQHIIYKNPEILQFVSGMKLKNNNTLLLTSSRLQIYINTLQSSPDRNYCIIEINIDDLLFGTPCGRNESYTGK